MEADDESLERSSGSIDAMGCESEKTARRRAFQLNADRQVAIRKLLSIPDDVIHSTDHFDVDYSHNPDGPLAKANVGSGFSAFNCIVKYPIGPFAKGTEINVIQFDIERGIVEVVPKVSFYHGVDVIAFEYCLCISNVCANVWTKRPDLMMCEWNYCSTDRIVNVALDETVAMKVCPDCVPIKYRTGEISVVNGLEWSREIPRDRFIACNPFMSRYIQCMTQLVAVDSADVSTVGALCVSDAYTTNPSQGTSIVLSAKGIVGSYQLQHLTYGQPSLVTVDFGKSLVEIRDPCVTGESLSVFSEAEGMYLTRRCTHLYHTYFLRSNEDDSYRLEVALAGRCDRCNLYPVSCTKRARTRFYVDEW
jgi:hypothetical protein